VDCYSAPADTAATLRPTKPFARVRAFAELLGLIKIWSALIFQ
jgi:hypothetical protein